MKSNKSSTRKNPGDPPPKTDPKDRGSLRDIIREEKETLVSMFLTNASRSDLTAKYKLISDLSSRLSDEDRS